MTTFLVLSGLILSFGLIGIIVGSPRWIEVSFTLLIPLPTLILLIREVRNEKVP